MTIPTMWNEGGPSGLGWSEIEAFLRCHKEYQFAAVRKVTKPTNQTPDYFAVGSFVHAGRARWFAEAMSQSDETWQKIQADMTKTREDLPLPCSEEAYTTALRYVQEYVEHWSIRQKPDIVAVEHLLGPTEVHEHAPWTKRTARLDDFGFYPEFGNKLAIGECKTTAGSIADVANQYTMHGQPALQRLLWEAAPQGYATYGAVAGTVLDVVKKGMGGKKCEFARIPLDVPERVLALTRQALYDALLKRDALRWDSPAERNLTACTRLIGKARVACQYRDLCMFGKAGAIGYVTDDGKPLTSWTQEEDKLAAPWE